MSAGVREKISKKCAESAEIIKFGWAATDLTIRDLLMYASQT